MAPHVQVTRKEDKLMKFDGAKITEQGVTFAIAVVKPYILTSPSPHMSALVLKEC